MQRQRMQHPATTLERDPEVGGNCGLHTDRHTMRDLLAHVDRVLDSLDHLDAEQYLEQNRQTGGQ